MPESQLSIARRTRKFPCPPPVRSREDDRIVEVFLSVWQDGRFASRIDWPAQRRGIAAVGVDAAGTRAAVAFARAFSGTNHKEEELLRPIASALESEPALDLPGRRFRLRLYPLHLEELSRAEGSLAACALRDWAAAALPRLKVREKRYRFEVPVASLRGKFVARISVDVEVSGRTGGLTPVSVDRYLPSDPQRLESGVRKALTGRLPRLAAAAADVRVLLLELPMPGGGPVAALRHIRTLASEFAPPETPYFLAIADAHAWESDRNVRFWVCDRLGNPEDWEELPLPAFAESTAALASRDAGPLGALADKARDFAAAAKAPNTVRAYASDWDDFREWCAGHALSSLPAEPSAVALYLADRAATLKTSSLARRLTTIAKAHQAAGHLSPAGMSHAAVSEVWKGIKRVKGTAEEDKKPLLTADLRRLIRELPGGLLGVRDRALLLAGFAGGFRRSELAAIAVDDLEDTPEGIAVRLKRSKTDQEGQGRRVALPYGSDPSTCPVRAVRAWIEAARIESGPLFRAVDQFGFASERGLNPDSVAFVVKRAASAAGLDAAEYSGHSLRAGLVTQAAVNGAGELAIMKQTGHRSLATVRKYIRDGSLFRDNAATKLGL